MNSMNLNYCDLNLMYDEFSWFFLILCYYSYCAKFYDALRVETSKIL